jgi:glycosyltransferase involved in cell wall biosynthesis
VGEELAVHQVRLDLVLNWGCNVFTGWGNVGVNLLGLLANDPDFRPLSSCPMQASHFTGMDPLRFGQIARVMHDSNDWVYTDDCIWIDSVGNDLSTPTQNEAFHVGRVIIEQIPLPDAYKPLAQYDKLLTASTWSKDLLEDASGLTVECILEGIDPSLFYPVPKSGWLPQGFYIFSSGKVEFRKGQDVTLMAFKRFSAKHPDAHLITVWNSPFADLANGFKGSADAPLWLDASGFLDIKRWATDNGVDPSKIHDMGCFPNYVLPSVLHEVDVMLHPSRIESCTALPVKEAMACGIPVIAAYHSGMKDLLTEDNSLPLMRVTPIEGSSEYFFPRSGMQWYESDPQEIDDRLEWVYKNRAEAKALGLQASAWIRANRTWRQHVEQLKDWLL